MTQPPAPRPRLLPAEHGSWAFLLLPTLASLALRFSLPAIGLLLCGFAGFLGRVPLRRIVRSSKPSTFDRNLIVAYGLAAVLGLGLALRAPRWDFLWMLAPAVPLGTWLLRVDLRGGVRSLAAEWTAVALPALLGAAMVRTGQGSWVLAAVLAAGSFLSLAAPLAYLRFRLALRRGGRASVSAVVLVHMAAAAVALYMQVTLGLRWLWPLWMAMLLLRVLLEPVIEPAIPDAKALGLRETLVCMVSALALVISTQGL